MVKRSLLTLNFPWMSIPRWENLASAFRPSWSLLGFLYSLFWGYSKDGWDPIRFRCIDMSELPVGGPAFAVLILRESILAKGLQQYFNECMLGGWWGAFLCQFLSQAGKLTLGLGV